MKATLKTNKGDMVIEFFDKETPNTVANFIKLSRNPDFMMGLNFTGLSKTL